MLQFFENTSRHLLISVRPLLWLLLSSALQAKAGPEPGIMTSNMFDLQYEKILRVKPERLGGGLGQTKDELVIVTGDGQFAVLALNSGELTDHNVALPRNNIEGALTLAEQEFSGAQLERAQKKVSTHLRYNDVLVFEGKEKSHLVLSYSHYDPDRLCFTHRVSMAAFPAGQSIDSLSIAEEGWEKIYEAEPCFGFRHKRMPFAGHQSGGRIDILDAENGDIVLALGDYEFDGLHVPDYPQDRSVDYGKVLRINLFSRESQIISIGHRNPQGITVDGDGRVWSVEHGPQGGDELNLSIAGKNFGWPRVILGIQYGNKPWPLNRSQGRHENYDYPVYAWVPSIATSNIDQSKGFHPFWEGDLLVFTLQTKSIHRLRIHEESDF